MDEIMTDPMLIEASGGAAYFPDPKPEPPLPLSDSVITQMRGNKAYNVFFELQAATANRYRRR